jgi:hypothetical protein
VARACDQLGLDVMRRASRSARADAAAFVDLGLRRSPADWGGLDVPEALRARADELWARLSV